MSNPINIGKVRIELTDALPVKFPGDPTGGTDSNSPAWWWDGKLHVINSTGHPYRSLGEDVSHLVSTGGVVFSNTIDGGRWIEAVYQEPDGTLYGWYHNEPMRLIPEEVQQGRPNRLTAPRIGALVSHDQGVTWEDLGIVIEGGPDTLNYETQNYFFAGGNGDFTVILDRRGEYFYFLIGTYYKDVSQQGVSVARMPFADRASPVGKVVKWYAGGWQEPGLGGRVTPIFPARSDWNGPHPDAFWGPSVHWNRAIGQYVMLLNRAIDPLWKQEGIYVSLSPDLSNPASWSEPVRLLESTGWYPQVIGEDRAMQDTDREAGEFCRLFIHGTSRHILRFTADNP